MARRRRLVISGGPGSSAPCRSVYRGDGCKGVRVGDMLSYPAPQGRACGRLFVIPGVPGCVVREASCHPRRPSLVCPISPVRGVVQGIRVRIFRVRVFRVQRGLLGVVLLVLCGRRRHASSVVGCRHTFLGMVYVAAHERGRRGWCSVNWGDGCKGVRAGDMLSYPAPQGRACGRHFVIPGVPGCVVREASCHPRRPSLVCPISSVRVLRVQRGLLGVVLLVLCGRRRHASSVAGSRHTFLGMAYVAAHEWCLACMGMSVPGLGSDGISSTPLQLLGRAFARPTPGFLCGLPIEMALSRL